MFNHPVFGIITLEDLTPKQLLSCYLQWSYLYYIRMENAVEDEIYDKAAVILLDRIDEWKYCDKPHQHQHLVTEGDLKAGTLFMLGMNDYPMIIEVTCEDWIREEYREGYAKYRT